MNTNYPTVVKTVSEDAGVEIRFANVIPTDTTSWRVKDYPLTVDIVPHNGMLYLGFSNMAGTSIKIEKYGPNQMYIKFVPSHEV